MCKSLNFLLLDVLFDIEFSLLGCLIGLLVEQLVLVWCLNLLDLIILANNLGTVLVHAHKYLVLKIGNSVALNSINHFVVQRLAMP